MLFVLLHRGALKEDLDGSVIIPAAQWIALCNVAKPFSSLLTGPSPQHPSSARPLSSSRRHTPLSLHLRLLYSRITHEYERCRRQGQARAAILSNGSFDRRLFKAGDINRR